jgi:F-type H+-transporting ATPase subunit delta
LRGEGGVLARRYARAALDVAEMRGGAGGPSVLGSDLLTLVGLIDRHAPLRAALADPRVDLDARRRVLEAIAQKAGLSELTRRLVALLISRDRLWLLPALAEAASAEILARRGVLPAEATSAVPLIETQRRALARALGKASGLEVELRTHVDPEVLGGVRVKMGGKTYDGTVRAHLAALRQSLATGR